MLVFVSGQPINQMPDPTYDTPFKEWVTDSADKMFGNWTEGLWHTGDIKNGSGTGIADAVADKVIYLAGQFAKHVGIYLLKMAPELLLITCMASILGIMIGSERCKHYAGVSALGAMITAVVNHAM